MPLSAGDYLKSLVNENSRKTNVFKKEIRINRYPTKSNLILDYVPLIFF